MYTKKTSFFFLNSIFKPPPEFDELMLGHEDTQAVWIKKVKRAKKIKVFDGIVKELLGHTIDDHLSNYEPSEKRKLLARIFTHQVRCYHGLKICYAYEDVLGFILAKDWHYNLFEEDNAWGYMFPAPTLTSEKIPPGNLSQSDLDQVELNRIQNMVSLGSCI